MYVYIYIYIYVICVHAYYINFWSAYSRYDEPMMEWESQDKLSGMDCVSLESVASPYASTPWHAGLSQYCSLIN